MEFILRDNFIYIVGNPGKTNNKVEGRLVTKYVADARNKHFTYSVNDLPYQKVVNGKISINVNELKTRYVKLRIKAVSNTGIEMFESDKIPFTQAIIFGNKLEDNYPEVIQGLFRRMDTYDRKMSQFITALEQINKKGNLF